MVLLLHLHPCNGETSEINRNPPKCVDDPMIDDDRARAIEWFEVLAEERGRGAKFMRSATRGVTSSGSHKFIGCFGNRKKVAKQRN